MRLTCFRFFFYGIIPPKKIGTISCYGRQYRTPMSLPPTGSLRRGGRFCDASPFFCLGTSPAPKLGSPSSPDSHSLPRFLHESGYWLRKHRIDMPVDSRGQFAYFECVIGLENP